MRSKRDSDAPPMTGTPSSKPAHTPIAPPPRHHATAHEPIKPVQPKAKKGY